MSQKCLVYPLALAAALSACASRTPRRVAANVPQQAAPAVVLAVTAQKFAFVPREIRVKLNQVVELQLVSVDTNHGFGLKRYGIRTELPKGQTVSVRFLADELGEFPFECVVFCGLGHFRMEGKLIVE